MAKSGNMEIFVKFKNALSGLHFNIFIRFIKIINKSLCLDVMAVKYQNSKIYAKFNDDLILLLIWHL